MRYTLDALDVGEMYIKYYIVKVHFKRTLISTLGMWQKLIFTVSQF